MEIKWNHLIFLLICILSRILSAIYYVEDQESLNFSLCVSNSWSHLAYEHSAYVSLIFCYLTKIFFFIFGNIPIAFSFIGGFSTYFLCMSVLRLLRLPLYSLEGGLLALLLFFNPLIWWMSNRYLSDLMGLAVAMAAFSYLVLDTYKNKDIYIGYFLAGLLLGIKASFLPFLLLPVFYKFLSEKIYVKSVLFLFCGVLFWAIPEILLRGENSFWDLISDSIRHAFELKMDKNKLIIIIRSLWDVGLGGYWPGRNPLLIIYSIGLLACLVFGFYILKGFGYSRSKILVAAGSWMFYVLWLFFFMDNISINKEVIPLIPFVAVLISYGIIYILVNFNHLYVKVLVMVFLLTHIVLTINFVSEYSELFGKTYDKNLSLKIMPEKVF